MGRYFNQKVKHIRTEKLSPPIDELMKWSKTLYKEQHDFLRRICFYKLKFVQQSCLYCQVIVKKYVERQQTEHMS